jgi:RND family efflux transporter MFP subunit
LTEVVDLMTTHPAFIYVPAAVSVVAAAVLTAGCGAEPKAVAAAGSEPVAITTAVVQSRPVDRYLRVTGSLLADEQAEVGAEAAGRVVETPVERGSRVGQGAVLVRVAAAEAAAQLQEAEANAAQIEARLGLTHAERFDPARVPEVMNAQAALELADAEFARIRSLLDQKVVSQSEYDQRRTQVEAARQQYRMAQNASAQAYRSLEAARARVALARKAMADTTVRAPFAGLVAERLVSVGDYVARGTRVATVVRVDPLRVELTVPAQSVSLVKIGEPVRFAVDAYPGEEFSAKVRFVSPSLRPEQRALTIEAIAGNHDGRLKPGLFATALIRRPAAATPPALLVPATAVESVSGTSRVYVVADGKAVERIVTVGETHDQELELTTGVTKGEVVAADPRGRLTDGALVKIR